MFMSSQVNLIAGIKKGPMEEIFFFLLPKHINSQISVTNLRSMLVLIKGRWWTVTIFSTATATLWPGWVLQRWSLSNHSTPRVTPSPVGSGGAEWAEPIEQTWRETGSEVDIKDERHRDGSSQGCRGLGLVDSSAAVSHLPLWRRNLLPGHSGQHRETWRGGALHQGPTA